MFGIERQITSGPGGRILTNINVWSPDGQWIVYDTRSDAEGAVFDGPIIEMVHCEAGDVRRLYESVRGAHCGVATFHPQQELVAFILGPENPTSEWQYGPAHRQGVMVELARPGIAVNLDARDLTPPGTPGALRGGSHVHIFSPDGEWVSFTYNDAVQNTEQRNVAIGVLLGPIVVSKDHPRNHDGKYYSVLVTRTTARPRSGSDEISQALEDGWVGEKGYKRANGTQQRRAIAFQGQVAGANGDTLWEVFLADLPYDVTNSVPGMSQRRLTRTENRTYPGLQGPRHWLRSSPDGSQIACLMRDEAGIAQIWAVSPLGGEPRQITHDLWDVASAFTWSPDGRLIAYAADSSIFVAEANSGRSQRLTPPCASAEVPLPLACVFSPDGRKIAFLRRLADSAVLNAPRSNQICVVSLPTPSLAPSQTAK